MRDERVGHLRLLRLSARPVPQRTSMQPANGEGVEASNKVDNDARLVRRVTPRAFGPLSVSDDYLESTSFTTNNSITIVRLLPEDANQDALSDALFTVLMRLFLSQRPERMNSVVRSSFEVAQGYRLDSLHSLQSGALEHFYCPKVFPISALSLFPLQSCILVPTCSSFANLTS